MKTLEDCRCGAHRYLLVRERKKALSIYEAHITRGARGKQNLLLLTKINLSALEFHRPGKEGPGDLDYYKEIVVQHVKEELAYLSNMQKRQEKKKEGPTKRSGAPV